MLPSKLAEWIGDNMRTELQIPDMTQAKWTVGELNQILANNLVPNGDGGHLRSFTTLQARVKTTCYITWHIAQYITHRLTYACRIVLSWWLSNHTILLRLSPSISELTWTYPVTASCGTLCLSYIFGVQCAPQAPFDIPGSTRY